MAEEDLIFGKNRHFFGGIEPSNMLAFSVAVESGVVKVTATLPNDTVVNNQTLCTVEGAISGGRQPIILRTSSMVIWSPTSKRPLSSQIVVHLLPELTTMQHSLIPLRVCITGIKLTA